MAQTNTVLTQIAVKRLSGKAQTNANSSLGQEPKGSTVQTTATTVFAEALPNNPAQTLYLIQSESVGSPGTAMFAEFEIRAFGDQYANDGQDGETTVNTFHAYELILSTSFDDGISSGDFNTHASTPTSFGTFPFDGGSSMTGSRGRLQIIPEFVSDIPAGQGASNPYIPQLFSTANPNSSPIDATDPIDWYLDAFSGILFIQDPVAYGSIGSPNTNAAVPFKIKAFAYVGKYQDQATFTANDVGLHLSASEGGGFSLANNATASFESGSAGITVTADASKKITIGKATDDVFFNDVSASGDLYVSKSIFIDDGTGGYADATIEVNNDRLEIKDLGSIRIAMDSDGDTTGGSAKKIEFGTGSAGAADFQSLMTISSSGKVGIGTTSPTNTLSVVGDGDISGNLTSSNLLITNTASITYFETTYQSSSIIFSSGSTKFGDTMDDTHVFTGSLFVTGNLTLEDGSIETDMFIASSSTTNAGFVFRPSDNDLTANRINLTSAENMQFRAGGVFQFFSDLTLNSGTDVIFKDDDNTSGFKIGNLSANTGSGDQNNTRLGLKNNGGTEIVSISGSGNVGIGTTTPNKQLTIQDGEAQITGSSTKRLYIEASGQGDVEAGLRLASWRTSAGNVGTSTLFKTGSTTILSLDEDITIRNNQKSSFVIHGSGDVQFVSSSDTTNTTLTSYLYGDNENKRIGIGEGLITPTETLDITGSAKIRGPFSQLVLANNPNDAFLEMGMTDSGHFYFKRGDDTSTINFRKLDLTDVMTIQMDTERVGIGTTTPDEKLTVEGNISASGFVSGSDLYVTSTLTALDGGVTIDTNTSPELFVGGNITSSGTISASGQLFAGIPQDSDDSGTNTVVYNPLTGEFEYTGSYGAGGNTSDLEASASAGIFLSASEGTGFSIGLMQSASFTSGSGDGLTVTAGSTNNIEFELVGVLSSSQQIATDISGAIDAATASLSSSIIGTTYEVEVTDGGTAGNIVIGLPNEVRISSSLQVGTAAADPDVATITTSHTGDFNLINANATTINFGGAATTINMGAAGASNVSIKGSASIDGDLLVKGTTTSINTDQLLVEDPFILLASSSSDPNTDGGIVIQTDASANGTALFYDRSSNRWALAQSSSVAHNVGASAAVAQQYVVSVSSSTANPSGTPSNFGNSSIAQLGMMYVATTDNDNDTNTIWIYG